MHRNKELDLNKLREDYDNDTRPFKEKMIRDSDYLDSLKSDGKTYKHRLTGNVGVHVKTFKPTGKPLTTHIKLSDGRVYYAPHSEFQLQE